ERRYLAQLGMIHSDARHSRQDGSAPRGQDMPEDSSPKRQRGTQSAGQRIHNKPCKTPSPLAGEGRVRGTRLTWSQQSVVDSFSVPKGPFKQPRPTERSERALGFETRAFVRP